jgi:predicted nucleic acid-binding protein
MKSSKTARPAAVIDASCLIYLLHLDLLTVLVLKHTIIYVPRRVWEEVSAKHRSRHRLQRIRKDYKFLKQCAVTDEISVRVLSDKELNPKASIHRGEAEVIVQAQTRGITDVLVDDRDGRRRASRGFFFVANRNVRTFS